MLIHDPNTAAVHEELRGRLETLTRSGVVDIKMVCSPDQTLSAIDRLWILNNVVRQYQAGAGERRTIGRRG